MKLLNVGCGAVRPSGPWINMDTLRSHLQPGTPERINLDKETNYIDHDITHYHWPDVGDNAGYDGILCSHVIEHFDCHEAVNILTECRRKLKDGGLLVVSVPDAEYFLSVYEHDKPHRAVELFGEPICPDEPWHKSFFDYALFYNQHKQTYTEDAVRCQLLRAGFGLSNIYPLKTDYRIHWHTPLPQNNALLEIERIMNRRKFSVELCAIK